MFKQQIRSIYSFTNMFLLVFQSFLPGIFAFLPTQAYAQDRQEIGGVALEFSNESNEFDLSIVAQSDVEYVLSYEDKDGVTKGITGTAQVENGVAQATEYAGTCSTDENCVPDSFAKGILTLPIAEYKSDFVLSDAGLWLVSDSVATLYSVDLGVEYVAPQNDGVRVQFTKLPENPGNLRIEEIKLSDEQVTELGAYSNVAYDISSDMPDGSFEYTLQLPLPEGADGNSQLVYAESIAELSSAQKIESGEIVSETMVAEGLDHFTVFVVVPADSGSMAIAENTPGWMFNRDTTTMTPYEFNIEESSSGLGSLYVLPITNSLGTPGAKDKFIAENFINTPIADIDFISYDYMIGSGGVAEDKVHFYMNVYANFGVSDDLKYYDCRYDIVPTIGSIAGFTTVTFDPTQAYPVTTRTGGSASPYTCPSIPANMDSLSPGSNIRVFALNVGDTSVNDQDLDGYLDTVVVSINGEQTVHDFEPIIPTTPTIQTPAHQSVLTTANLTKIDWSESTGQAPVQYQYQAFSDANYTTHRYTSSWLSNSEIATPGTPAGSYYIRVKARDNTGLESDWSNSAANPYLVKVDNTAPDVFITGPSDNSEVTGTIMFKGTVLDENPWRYYYNISGVTSNTVYHNTGFTDQMVYSWNTSLVPDGEYTLRLEARDKAQNKDAGSVAEITVTVNNQAPSIPANLRYYDPAISSEIPCGIVTTPKTLWPRWNANAEPDFSHYEYTSYDAIHTPPGWQIGLNEVMMTTTEFQHGWVPPMDGTYGFAVRAVDSAGNKSAWAVGGTKTLDDSCQYTVDRVAPVTTLTSPTPGSTNQPITIAGSSTDLNTVATVSLFYSEAGQNNWQPITTISNAGSLQPFAFSYVWTPSLQGTYDIKASGTDMAGNVENSAYVYGVTYDTTAPSTPSLNTPMDGFKTKGVAFTQKWFSVSDAVSYEYQSCNTDPGDVNGTCSSVKFSQTFSGVNNTTKSVGAGQPNSHFWWRVRAKDSANNWSNWSESRELIIDNSAPTTVWDSLASTYFSATPVLTGVGTDVYLAGIANVTYRVENTSDATTVFDWQNATPSDGTFNGITENFVTNLSSLADGAYTFLARSIDQVGNQGVATEVDLIVDTTDPSSEITTFDLEDGEEVETATFDGLLEGTATDLPTDIASGVDHVLLSISHLGFGEDESETKHWDATGSAWVSEQSLFRADWNDSEQTWSYQLPSENTPEGFYTVVSHAVDKAGNVEDTYTIKIVYDKTIPEVNLTIDPTNPNGNNGWYKTQPTITLTANDNYFVDHIEYQWNSTSDAGWTTYSTPFNPPGEGQNILYYRAVDTVGNPSETGIKEVKFDKTVPANGPLNVRVENIGSVEAVGKWDKPSGDEQVHEYKLSWKHVETGKEYSDTVSASTYEHKLTNLFDGIWEFRVQLLDTAGNNKDASTQFRVGPEPASTVLGATTDQSTGFGTGGSFTTQQAIEDQAEDVDSEENAEDAEEAGTVLGESDSTCAPWQFYLPLFLLLIQALFAVSLEFINKELSAKKLLIAMVISGLMIGAYFMLRDSSCYTGASVMQTLSKFFVPVSLLLAFILRVVGSVTVEEK